MKILGFDYELIYTNDSGYLGMCEPAKLQIHIDPYAPLQRKIGGVEKIMGEHKCGYTQGEDGRWRLS